MKVQELRDIVRKRQVCFDAFGEQVGFQVEGSRAVGYELVLSGIHAQVSHPPQPGCDLCRDVYADLKEIAEWIWPKEHRASFYEIEPYRPVIRATRKRQAPRRGDALRQDPSSRPLRRADRQV